jgi:serine/threonine protein kinase/WD40 repeat protein
LARERLHFGEKIMPNSEKPKQTDFQREQAIFLAAVEAGGAAERGAVLDRECGGDAGLRQRVEALLAAHDAEGSLPPAGPAVDETRALDAMAGVIVAGRYKLLQEIGQGGMGVVWMAEQRSPVRRLVAVKLIKAGMDSRSVIARFEAERQALAMMDHPNIARVFDGGITEQGRPFFAMELVRGLPVTDYCDQRRMTVRDRLLLFTQICHAVQHAHQKGIIHRDIKPGNVLVTEHDGEPVPKVIDFGLAKALGGAGVLSEHTLYTAFGEMAGTPLYTAPEQVAINALDIDTRADIYALGVLLYELLTGSPPLDRERLKLAAWDEVCRVIREEEPPRPSTRISTSLLLPSLAASRQTDPGKLSGLLKGDLDWIILKTLEKERRLRYDTATALVADIERHLNDEPVVAAPPSVGYRTRKFVRKHKTAVVVGTAGATLLTLGLTTTTWEWRRADANAYTARQNELVAEVQKIEADKQRDAAELEAYIANVALGQSAMQNNNWPEARRRFDACQMAKRGFEWNFLSTKARSVVAVVPKALEGIVFSPDGRLGLSASSSETVQLWDMSGNLVGEPMNICKGSKSAFFCPNGRLVVTDLGNGNTQLWDLSGKPVGAPIRTGKIAVEAVCNPDGQHVLAMPDDRTVQSQEVSGRLVGDAMQHTAAVNSAVFSPDGRFVLTESKDGTARLWNVVGRPVGELMHEGGGVRVDLCRPRAAFSPDGKLLITTSDDQHVVRIWDLTGKPVGKPMKHVNCVTSASFNSDNRIVITKEQRITGNAIYSEVRIWLWDLNGSSLQSYKEQRIPSNESTVAASALPSSGLSPDGRLRLTLADDGCAIQLHDIAGKPVGRPMQNESRLKQARFSPDGKLVLTESRDDIVRLWDLNGEPFGEPMLKSGNASFVPGGHRVVTESFGTCVWDLQGKEMGATVAASSVCALDPNGDNLITSENPYSSPAYLIVRVNHVDSPIADFDFDALMARDEIIALNATIQRSPAISTASIPARTIRLAVTGATVELVAAGVDPIVFRHDQPVTAAAVSPDGLRAVTSTGKVVRFWDTASGREMAEIPADYDVRDLQFTPDDAQLILTFEGGGVQVWDSRPFEERQKDRDARFAEFKPARQYVDRLLATTTPIDRLADIIRKDESLNAIRRVQALRWLGCKLKGTDDRAKVVLQEISGDALTRGELHEKLATVKCPPRVADCVAKNIAKWEEPKGEGLLNRAVSVFVEPALPTKRYTTAFQAVVAAFGNAPTDPDVLLVLGEGNYRVGQFKEALKNLSRSAELILAKEHRTDRTEWAFIAMAQVSLGRLDEARQALAKMRIGTLAPNYEPDTELEAEAIWLIERASPMPGAKKLVDEFERWSWAPDGAQIVYVSGWPSPEADLRILDLQTNQSRVFVKDGHDPAWSPGDGRWIAFERRRNGDQSTAEIWVVPSVGGEPRKLCDGSFPSWSADGKAIYFYSYQMQKLLAIKPSEPSAKPTEFANVDWYYPAISPDGKRVVFFGDHNLTITDRKTDKTVLTLPLAGWEGLIASWSPDGKQIAYGSYGVDSSDGLWIYDFETKRQLKVADGPWTCPIWSPDGSKFTFQLRGPQEASIWMVDAKVLDSLKANNKPVSTQPASKPAPPKTAPATAPSSR